MGRLQDKIAIVTGGSRGIGRAICERFAEEGARVIAAQRSAPATPFEHCDRIVSRQLDVADGAAVSDLIASCVREFGGLDIVVNNAGIMFEKNMEATAEDEWDRLMAVNLRAPFLLSKFAVPELRKRGGGAIVNIGSIEGLGANPGHTAYAASKAGVHGLTAAVAVDHGADRIRCNAICPGWIETEMNESYLAERADRAEIEDELARLHPAGRLGKPADVANMALWLASDEAAFVTGQLFVVDGGRTKKLPLPAMLE